MNLLCEVCLFGIGGLDGGMLVIPLFEIAGYHATIFMRSYRFYCSLHVGICEAISHLDFAAGFSGAGALDTLFSLITL
jgi:hypothetical protein